MPITLPELLSDLPELADLFNTVAAGVEGLPKPPAPIHAVDYGKIVEVATPKLCSLIDTLVAQSAS